MRARLLAAVLISTGFFATAQAEKTEFDAKHFVNTKCVACHDSTVYTRENRRVKSLERLESQVRRCDANLGTTLFDDDLISVVDYLNDTYYQFEN